MEPEKWFLEVKVDITLMKDDTGARDDAASRAVFQDCHTSQGSPLTLR